VFTLQGIGTLNLLLVILGFATLLSGLLFLIARKRRMGK
jgi:LPXTG-motif cell wall-anchored protein